MTINPSTKEMRMVRGDSEMIVVRCPDEPFVPGDVIEFSVRKKVKTERLLHKIVTVFDNGVAHIMIDHSDTEPLDFGDYVYDIQVTRGSNGWVTTLVDTSKFVLKTEVTYDG